MLTWIVLPLLGVAVGALSGLIGIGGGIILVPMLVMILPLLNIVHEVAVPMALGTSLACVCLTLMSSSIAHKRHGNFEQSVFYQLLPGIVFGAMISPYIVHLLPTTVLRIIIGLILLALAINAAFDYEVPKSRTLPAPTVIVLSSFGIGLLAAFGGLSGAVLLVPYLMWFGIPMRMAFGTAGMCGFSLSLVGMVSYMFVGLNVQNLPMGSIGYVYWPAVILIAATSIPVAQIAAKWSLHVPKEQLKRLLSIVLTLVACKMLFF